MVSKSGLDLQRRDRSSPPRNLAPSDFFHVPAKPRQYRNSVPYLAAHGKCSRSRRLNRPKSSLARLTNVDLFFSIIVLQHNPPPVILGILDAAFAGLRPGGLAFFQVPTY